MFVFLSRRKSLPHGKYLSLTFQITNNESTDYVTDLKRVNERCCYLILPLVLVFCTY